MSAASLATRIKSHRFFIGEPASDKAFVLNQRRIYILPTLRGLGFIVLLILLLLIAFVYNNNLAYMLTFLLASVFFVTILHSFKALAGLSLQKGQSKAVFAGEAAGFEIHIDNPTNAVREHLQCTLEQTESLTIPAQSKAHITLYALTQKRGWYKAGKITVFSTYPLGFFRAWSSVRFDLKVLVYPKPSALEIAFPETAAAESSQDISKKGNDDFYGLQEYQPGDPVKRIHWKAYARGLGIYSKQYSSGTTAEIWLDYDYTPGHTTEERLSQLCRWVIDADRAGIGYGFALPGLRIEPDSGIAHTEKCLSALALF